MYPTITNPLSGEKRVRIISTPNGKSGRFYKIVDENLLNPVAGRKSRWSVHRVTIEDAAPEFAAVGFPLDLAALREELDSPEAWAQEYLCEFADSSDCLLPYDVLAMGESATATKFADPALFTSRAPNLFCGVDFGRQNDPTVCWTLQLDGDVLWTREVLVLKGYDTPAQQAALTHRLAAARRACFDYTGPGVGLGDYLVRDRRIGEFDAAAHKFGRLELCTFTAAFKREIFPRLRRAFEAPTRLRIPVDTEVREDLHAVRQVVTGGQYSYVAPRTAEGHSDRCTALALALRAAGTPGSGHTASSAPARVASPAARRINQLCGLGRANRAARAAL